MEMPSDFERALMFEHISKAAEATYAKNPLDTDVCTPILHKCFYIWSITFDDFFCFFTLGFVWVLDLFQFY